MLGECPNSEDEANCTCADFLKAQLLHEKICDGVADCFDYSDETDCGIRILRITISFSIVKNFYKLEKDIRENQKYRNKDSEIRTNLKKM